MEYYLNGNKDMISIVVFNLLETKTVTFGELQTTPRKRYVSSRHHLFSWIWNTSHVVVKVLSMFVISITFV